MASASSQDSIIVPKAHRSDARSASQSEPLAAIDDGSYLERLCEMLAAIERDEATAIEQAAHIIYRSFRAGGVLHVFSTGHSHMIVDELFYRSGGLAPVNPLLTSELMLFEGALAGTLLERKPGMATELLSRAGLAAGDSILISSNSGINTAPVEAALYARERGLSVICVTSTTVSSGMTSRHPDGKRLFEVADIVIDNHVPDGDGLMEVPGTRQITGGASTFGSLFIAQRIVLKVENLFLADGMIPPIFQSANLPGGDDYNLALMRQYSARIPAFR